MHPNRVTSDEVVAIAADLSEIRDDEIVVRVRQRPFCRDGDPEHALAHFQRARLHHKSRG